MWQNTVVHRLAKNKNQWWMADKDKARKNSSKGDETGLVQLALSERQTMNVIRDFVQLNA